ncbi:MAG: YciI family protein [Schleiferiaceae bacterium]|jgi:uncharacterized protein YciI|nr:YciI family protein [Schleiferiaceae bacterium]
MKNLALMVCLGLAFCGWAQSEEMKKDIDGCPIFEMPEGDTVFTMKQYFFVMLKAGESRGQDEAETAKIQEGHLAHLNSLGESGKLCIAGPFGDDGDWRGILIFKVPTEEEVRELVEADPAFKAGRLSYEVHPWWAGKGSKLD